MAGGVVNVDQVRAGELGRTFDNFGILSGTEASPDQIAALARYVST